MTNASAAKGVATSWAVIPIKAPQQCKTRLRAALSDAARERLVAAMLRHVFETAASAPGVDEVRVLSPSLHELPLTTPLLPDHGEGLNRELQRALHAALASGVKRFLVLAADLPALTRADVKALAAAPGLAIAPDRSGAGTNALSLPLPAAKEFRFQFGPGSFEAHRNEALRLGAPAERVQTATLALDVDEAADLAALPIPFRTLI